LFDEAPPAPSRVEGRPGTDHCLRIYRGDRLSYASGFYKTEVRFLWRPSHFGRGVATTAVDRREPLSGETADDVCERPFNRNARNCGRKSTIAKRYSTKGE